MALYQGLDEQNPYYYYIMLKIKLNGNKNEI